MKFSAKALLEQQGWKEGQGLGKEKQGIKDAIKVNVKNDKFGVGHDLGEEFTYHWWDHAFNRAAKNIKGTIQLSKEGETTELSTKKLSKKSKKNKKANKSDVYKSFGNFVKAATLTDGQLTQLIDDDQDDDEEEKEDESGAVSNYTDEELFKLCGGLTAHKGARHGINLKGKLDRINEQERHHHQQKKQKGSGESGLSTSLITGLRTDNNSLNTCIMPETFVYNDENICKKKTKKHKMKKCDSLTDNDDGGVDVLGVTEGTKIVEHKNVDSTIDSVCPADDVNKPRKSKKRRKNSDADAPIDCISSTQANIDRTLSLKKKKI
ncbi:hypothetical protein HELRODRAFT_175127 [Helobdella robusta]|uniref:G patch domain-containing protein 4 n=1 Tax=Helobdella robusta TaxID=6412 RepID=T1F8W2_HELRO|nr:hypothetical protein HELRODRAFT_175127 [Helobdella robusta]ESO01097.1 hypothetical protein HELRODRAFT_175127 [Helobdella robusta]